MATGTVSSRPPKDSAPIQGRYGDFIQQRLEQTRRQVRLVDAGSGIVLFLAASLFFFLLVALADHWLFAHGLNFFGRLLLFGVWMAAAGRFLWRAVAPAIMHRINPVFAAQAIEHGRPALKNSLINFLLLRSHPENVAPVVYQAMEHRAATDLSRVPIDQAVDHRRFIHLCYALAAAVALFALYLALSPKNPLVSAARVMFPWAPLAAPTRVHIEDIDPGDRVVYQGDRVKISARVSSLRDGEQVSLLMSTADGQVVDDRVMMNHTGEDNRYECELPSGSGGLLQTTSYRITAGDATTQQFKLDVEIAPTINVDQVDYHFPAYMGMKDRSIKGQGDIKALEGTRVTIHATANVEIKKAQIDLGCTGLRMIPMSLNGKQATGEFTLAAEQEPGQAWKPLYDHYQILLTDDSQDHKVRQHPTRYRIDVDRDYPPEVAIIEPKPETVDVPLGGHLRIRLHTSDDFGLRRVAIQAEHDKLPLDLRVFFDRLPPDTAFSKPYDAEYDFIPAALHLKKGDEVKYWVEADDNKEPKHNHAETAPRTIRIVDEQDAQRGQGNKDKQDSGQPQPGDKSQGDKGQGEKGQGEKGQAKSDKAGDKSSDPSQDGSPKGETSPDKKGDGKGDTTKSQKPENGSKSNPSKSENGESGKDKTSSESKEGQRGEPESSGDSDSGKKRTDGSQTADAMREIAKDMEKKEKEQEKNAPSSENSKSGQPPEQKQQGGSKDDCPQGGGSQEAGQPKNPSQSGQGNPSSQGSQGTQQSQGAPGDKSKQGGASGSPQPSGKNPNDSAGNNTPSQESKPGAQDSANPGNQKTSPQPGDNAQQPSSGSPSQGSPKAGSQPNAGQPSPQSSGGQGKDQAKSSAGPKKDGGSSGAGNKPDAKQAGGSKDKDQSASGGTQSPKDKAAGGGKDGAGQPGGDQAKSEQKPSGGQGGDDSKQLAMKGGDSPKKNPSQGGSSDSRDSQGGSKPDKSPKPQSNSGGDGGQNSQSQPKEEKEQNDGGSGAGGQQQPKPGGDQPKPGGGKSSPNGTPNGKPGTMANGDQPGQKDPGKSGEGTRQDSSGAPDPQADPQHGEQKPGDAHEGLNQKSDNAQSPSTSPHDSNSEGDTRGTSKGGGGAGGGQHDEKAGKGAAGDHMPAKEGGSASNETGGDAPGKKSGETATATDKTGSPRKESGGNGSSGDKPERSDKQAANEPQNKSDNTKPNSSDTPQGNGGGQSGVPSSNQATQQGTGQPTGGFRGGNQPPAPQSKGASEGKADEADQKFAKSQVDMALRHLKDESSKPKSDLLDRLGWTPEEAKKFAENIEKLRDSAKQPGSEGDAKKKDYNEFLKDLGLRAHGTRLQGGRTKSDDFHGVRDAPQMEAPAEWDEITRGYLQTTSAGQK